MTTISANTLTLTSGQDKLGYESNYLDLFTKSDPNVFIEFLDGNDSLYARSSAAGSIDDIYHYNIYAKLGAGDDNVEFGSQYSGNNFYIFGGSGFDEIMLVEWKKIEIADGTLVLTLPRVPGSAYSHLPDSKLTIHPDVDVIQDFATGDYLRVDELLQGIENRLDFQEYNEYRALG